MFDVKSQKAPASAVSVNYKKHGELRTIMCIPDRANPLEELLGGFRCRRGIVDEAEAVFALVEVR
jgi:hypothetical protein